MADEFTRMCPCAVREAAPTICVLLEDHEGVCLDFRDVLESQVRKLTEENARLRAHIDKWAVQPYEPK